jgi:hypothetical protein
VLREPPPKPPSGTGATLPASRRIMKAIPPNKATATISASTTIVVELELEAVVAAEVVCSGTVVVWVLAGTLGVAFGVPWPAAAFELVRLGVLAAGLAVCGLVVCAGLLVVVPGVVLGAGALLAGAGVVVGAVLVDTPGGGANTAATAVAGDINASAGVTSASTAATDSAALRANKGECSDVCMLIFAAARIALRTPVGQPQLPHSAVLSICRRVRP